MGENDLITMVIPIYNVEQYLTNCLESVINQSYENIEIILVDDGSTDNSKKICRFYEKKDCRIRYIYKTNGGLSSARNCGIENAKGKYITFLDSDDTITIDYVQTLYDLIKKYNTRMSICAYTKLRNSKGENIGENYEETSLNTKECLGRMLLEKGFTVSANAKMYELGLFEHVRYPNGLLYEDNATTYKLILQCKNIAYSNKSIYTYFIRPGSITSDSFSNRHLDYIKITDEACKKILSTFPELSDECHYRKTYVRFTILKKMSLSKLTTEQNIIKNNLITELKSNKNWIKNSSCKDTKIALSSTLLNINYYLFKMGVYLLERIR